MPMIIVSKTLLSSKEYKSLNSYQRLALFELSALGSDRVGDAMYHLGNKEYLELFVKMGFIHVDGLYFEFISKDIKLDNVKARVAACKKRKKQKLDNEASVKTPSVNAVANGSVENIAEASKLTLGSSTDQLEELGLSKEDTPSWIPKIDYEMMKKIFNHVMPSHGVSMIDDIDNRRPAMKAQWIRIAKKIKRNIAAGKIVPQEITTKLVLKGFADFLVKATKVDWMMGRLPNTYVCKSDYLFSVKAFNTINEIELAKN